MAVVTARYMCSSLVVRPMDLVLTPGPLLAAVDNINGLHWAPIVTSLHWTPIVTSHGYSAGFMLLHVHMGVISACIDQYISLSRVKILIVSHPNVSITTMVLSRVDLQIHI